MINTEINSIPHAHIDKHILNMETTHHRSSARGSELVCTSDAAMPVTSLTVYGNTNGSNGVGEPTDKDLYEIPVCITGKNLFDYANVDCVRGYIGVSGSSCQIVSSNKTDVFYIPCQPSTSYTFSRQRVEQAGQIFRLASTSQLPYTGMRISQYTIGNSDDLNITLTTGAEDGYLLFCAGLCLRSSTDIISDWQVEKGSSATELETFHTAQSFSVFTPSQLYANPALPYKLTLFSSKKTILTDLHDSRHRMTDITDIQQPDISPMLYAGTNIISVNTSVKPSEIVVAV